MSGLFVKYRGGPDVRLAIFAASGRRPVDWRQAQEQAGGSVSFSFDSHEDAARAVLRMIPIPGLDCTITEG